MRSDRERQAEAREVGLDFEEERELDDLAAIDLTNLQRPRLVAFTAGLRPVLPERRRAVRRLDRNDLRVAARVPGPEPPGEDVVPTCEPEVVRRHRLGRVL